MELLLFLTLAVNSITLSSIKSLSTNSSLNRKKSQGHLPNNYDKISWLSIHPNWAIDSDKIDNPISNLHYNVWV